MSCWPTVGFQFSSGPMITHLSPPQLSEMHELINMALYGKSSIMGANP